MHATYVSNSYDPSKNYKRYVRYSGYDKTFHFCEVNAQRYDVRQGSVERRELSEQLAEDAMKHYAISCGYIDWPY